MAIRISTEQFGISQRRRIKLDPPMTSEDNKLLRKLLPQVLKPATFEGEISPARHWSVGILKEKGWTVEEALARAEPFSEEHYAARILNDIRSITLRQEVADQEEVSVLILQLGGLIERAGFKFKWEPAILDSQRTKRRNADNLKKGNEKRKAEASAFYAPLQTRYDELRREGHLANKAYEIIAAELEEEAGISRTIKALRDHLK